MYIVINGGGKVGEYLASKLLKVGHEVAVIERNAARVEYLVSTLASNALVIHGDGCDSAFQADAGNADADLFVAVTGDDDVNLVSCEIASLVFDSPRTIARVNNPRNERIFRRMGIEAVSSTMVISRLIEKEVVEGTSRAAQPLSKGGLIMIEATIPNQLPGEQTETKKVADVELPAGSLLIAVGHGTSLSVVTSSTTLNPGDIVTIVCKRGLENQVRTTLRKMWQL